MTDLLAVLGERASSRWLTSVLLPPLLFVVLGAATALMHGHPAGDTQHLIEQLNLRLDWIAAHRPGSQIIAVLAAAAIAAAAGWASTALAEHLIQRIWVAPAPPLLLRRRRARAERTAATRDPRPPQRYLPQRMTIAGDRLRLIGERIDAQYGLSVVAAWPRLWLLTDGETRAAVATAYQRYEADATLCAWAMLYLPLALWWWPMAPLAVALYLIGHLRARTAAAALAATIESVVDLNQHALATTLGLALPENRVTPTEGNRINDILTKRD